MRVGALFTLLLVLVFQELLGLGSENTVEKFSHCGAAGGGGGCDREVWKSPAGGTDEEGGGMEGK